VPLPLAEGEKLRDRMNSDEDKSTETLSTISRSLAAGLALITILSSFRTIKASSSPPIFGCS